MSVHAAPLDHRLWVVFAVLTHAAVGYTLASLAGRAPVATVVAAVLPDVDLLFPPAWPFPFVHRGLTHTPLFAIGLLGGLLALRRRPSTGEPAGWSVGAVALGYGSHLAMDSLTASGVPWLYPFSTTGYGVDLAVHAVEHGILVWLLAATVLVTHRRFRSDIG